MVSKLSKQSMVKVAGLVYSNIVMNIEIYC